MLYGKVLDKKTGKPVEFAEIFVSDSKGKMKFFDGRNIGVTSDLDGNFNIDVPPGEYYTIQHVSYPARTFFYSGISLENSETIYMEPGYELNEVEIVAKRTNWFKRNLPYILLAAALTGGVIIYKKRKKARK